MADNWVGLKKKQKTRSHYRLCLDPLCFAQLYGRFEEDAQGTDNQEKKRRNNEHKVHEEQSDGKKLKEQTEAPTLAMNNYETL